RPPSSAAMRSLTLAELAAESGASLDLLEWLVERRQLRALPDGTFDVRDSAIISTVQALLESGIARDDLAWAIDGAGAGFASLGRMFASPSPRSDRTYGELIESLGPAGRRLASIYAALGQSEPALDAHLRLAEEPVLGGDAQLWHEVDPD